MNESFRWTLPLLIAGQAQKEITHNEAVMAIDRLLHLAVVSRHLSNPPSDAKAGDAYIIAKQPTGDWTGREAIIATFDGGGWLFTLPRTGCLAWVADEGQFAVFGGSDWSNGGWPTQGLQIGDRTLLAAPAATVAPPIGGETVDAECRAALAALLVALGNQGVINQTV